MNHEGTPKASAPEKEDGTVLGTLRRIQSGELSPANISVDTRRAIVEHLSAEGYSVPEMAEILQMNERTIRRDRAAIREANSLDIDPGLTSEMAGALVQEADIVITRTRRAARSKDASASDRIQAEANCWKVRKELIEKLQSLGWLHQEPIEFTGQLSGSLGLAAPDPKLLLGQINELIGIAQGGDGEGHERLLALRAKAESLTLAEDVAQVGAQVGMEVSP